MLAEPFLQKACGGTVREMLHPAMMREFLSAGDVERAMRTLEKLAKHNISGWALTGGLATELHFVLRGRGPLLRELNDIDFVADSFEAIPKSLADDFWFRHIHPADPPGKTMVQMVDAENRLRVDVFRAFGETMRRTSVLKELLPVPVQLISLEDLLARSARLALDLSGGVATPAKYARDFVRLSELAKADDVETAWQDQRKKTDPASFAEASKVLHTLIPASAALLVTKEYSRDTNERCQRCKEEPQFVLAEPEAVLSLLGYC
jgi:hypothetical protein